MAVVDYSNGDSNILVSIRMGYLSNLGFTRRCWWVIGRRFVYCRDEKKRPRVAALFELSRPKMEMVIQLRYSFVVKHLPEMCLGLCNFRT